MNTNSTNKYSVIKLKTKLSNNNLKNFIIDIQKSFKHIKIACENRNSEKFPHNDIKNIINTMQYLKKYLINDLKLTDIPVSYFKDILNCDNYVTLFTKIKSNIENDREIIQKKKKVFTQFASYL